MLDLEGSAVGLPAVRLLALEAVEDLLPEQAVFVVDAVAEARHSERRHGLQKTGRQASQAAVPQAGVDLALHHIVEADTKAGQHLATQLLQAQVGQVVAQQAPHQPFHREVIELLGVLVAIARLGFQHAVNDAVADGEGDRLQIVSRFQFGHGTYEGVPDVPQDGLTQNLGRRNLRKKFRG